MDLNSHQENINLEMIFLYDVQQILPYFQPDYTVTIKPIDGWSNYKQDVPIVLNTVSILE